jgi:hypothetical protein
MSTVMRTFYIDTVVHHRFAVGSAVRFTRTAPLHPAVGPYEVLAQLPERDGECQYRIRSDREPYQRIVKEHELEPAPIFSR